MRNDFHLELQRLMIWFIVCFVMGILAGQLLLILLLGCMIYITWVLLQMRRLESWLKSNRSTSIPEASGIWGNIFDHLSRDKKRQIREKNRFKSVINRVETMTAAISDAVILLNSDQTISWLNKASRNLLNLKKTDVGTPITNLIRNPLFVNYLDRYDNKWPLVLPIMNEVEQQLEFRLNHFGKDEGLLIVRDVTRLYKLEQMRKDFVANVSHELRTPLTVISGYIETFGNSQQLDPSWRKPLTQLQQQTSRMTALVHDLTMLSTLETDSTRKDIVEILIEPLLQTIVDEIAAASRKQNHTLTIECPNTLMIIGNEKELHSALSNLVMNAVKYSDPQKNITIKAGINFTGGADIKVIDCGIGIERHHIARLTERFYRVDPSRSIDTGGTGLGLAIVKHVLARHNARLNISSRINHGSTFSAIFPKDRVKINSLN